MAHKILVLFLILSCYTSFSTSECNFGADYFPRNTLFYNRHLPRYLKCSDIYLNKEIQLNQDYEHFIAVYAIKSMHIFNSNISKLYDNTLKGFEHLQEVVFNNVSLREIDSNVFVTWANLSTLIFANNELTSIDFYVPPNIEHLNISHNKISQIKAFQNYDKLVDLNLSYNSISSIEDFGPFNALRNLDLSHNNLSLSSLANITWKNEQVLDSLILSANHLKYIPQSIQTILVKKLDLSHNYISAFDCANVTESINLSYNNFDKMCNFSKTIITIDIGNNKLTDIHEDTFKNMVYLEYLNLNCNFIETIQPTTFHDLINLQVLDLTDNIISELPKGLFYHLERLRTLYIAINYIEKFEHGTFTGLKNLLVLNVSDNGIENLDAIYSLKQLRELNIIDNNLHELDADQIITHLPYLRTINFNVDGISCEELMVNLLKFREKKIVVEKGEVSYHENVHGVYCNSDPDFKNKNQELNDHKMAYIATRSLRISVALIVILVVLAFVIVLLSLTLYRVYMKHRDQTKKDHTLHTCSLKLLSENDPLD